jgi:6-phosphogluconolactonase
MEKFFVGCFTDSKTALPYSSGKGISIVSLDTKLGILKEEKLLGKIENPAYLNINKDKNELYAATERFSEIGEIVIVKLDSLEVKSKVSSMGISTCYVCYDEVKDRLIWTNYKSGDFASYDLINNNIHYSKFEGSSINKERQESPHPHFVGFHKDTVLIADLGCDCIHVLDRNSDSLDSITEIKTPLGYGPRHMIVTDNRLYVLCELKAKLLVYNYDSKNSSWSLVQELDTEEPQFMDISAPAAIKKSNNIITVSNRFSNSLRQFKIEEDKCSVLNTVRLQGKVPRDFCYSKDGDYVLVALQDSNSIELYSVASNGEIEQEPLSIFDTGTPVCIKNY